jgi:hypothetical protein
LVVRLRFSPSLREVLMEVVARAYAARAAGPDERAALAPTVGEAPDADLQAAWAEGLREREEYDTLALLDLLKNPHFGQSDLFVASPAAEALARASVRARLHLRETILRDLNAAEAQGDVDVFDLPPAEQQGYACYRLLAYLESDLLIQLEPGLAQA